MATKQPLMPVYLDYAAATPTDERVIKVMVDCLRLQGTFANSASRDHVYGWQAAEVVETARGKVADLCGCSPLEIIFTSGATESNNLAILGLAKGLREKGDPRRRVVTSMVEHKAVLQSCLELQAQGYDVDFIRPRPDGSIDVDLLKEHLTDDTFLVSISQANSVVGTVNDMHALASLCRQRGIYYHSDCAQSAGYERLELDDSDISMISLTCEKICGPKGVGALFVKRSQNVPLKPLILGGGQERGLRSGTVASHQVAAMGEAFAIMKKEGARDKERMLKLREHLKEELLSIEGSRYNGSPDHHLPGILSISFEGIEPTVFLPSLTEVAASTGSACNSQSLEPSYVLTAMGIDPGLARTTVRLSLGRFTTAEEIDRVIACFKQEIPKLRGLNPKK